MTTEALTEFSPTVATDDLKLTLGARIAVRRMQMSWKRSLGETAAQGVLREVEITGTIIRTPAEAAAINYNNPAGVPHALTYHMQPDPYSEGHALEPTLIFYPADINPADIRMLPPLQSVSRD